MALSLYNFCPPRVFQPEQSSYQPTLKFSETMKSIRPLLRRVALYFGQLMILNLERTRDLLKAIFLRDLIDMY
jgi:hypothetical protein